MISTLRLAGRQAACQRITYASFAAGRAAASNWANVPQGPPSILGITEAFNADKNKNKMNLGVGAYRSKKDEPFVLFAVRECEKMLMKDLLDKEYLPILGYKPFLEEAAKLAYGNFDVELQRLAIAQSLSGTGALRIAGSFIQRFWPGEKTVYIPNPSWANHKAIFSDSGLQVAQYRYYNKETIGLDFDGLVADLEAAPERSVVLLHACAHNPTGIDPTQQQWHKISKVIKKRGHLALFDMAYQGFATGLLKADAFAVRHFVEEEHNIALCQSFAKNMGLYGERVGTFSMLCEDAAEKERVESQLKLIIRPMYSSPPLQGARLAHKVLTHKTMRIKWTHEVLSMAARIHDTRKRLKNHLVELGSQRNWDHLTSQIGMFAYTGLSPEEIDKLAKEFSIYATRDGRFSMAGVNRNNVEYLAQSIYTITG